MLTYSKTMQYILTCTERLIVLPQTVVYFNQVRVLRVKFSGKECAAVNIYRTF